MKVGTKSLLFGYHQFIMHPFFVVLGWNAEYGRLPTFRESICIMVHDWGLWGKPNMDGTEGRSHPELGARIASFLLALSDEHRWYEFCAAHSRHYALSKELPLSPLCAADKRSIDFIPDWLYILCTRLSGELEEYRGYSNDFFGLTVNDSDREWFRRFKTWYKDNRNNRESAKILTPGGHSI